MTRKLIIFAILYLVSTNGFAQSYSRVNPDSIPFAPAKNYYTGHGPTSVFCADLDRDGHADLAVVSVLDTTVSILFNNGNGTFQTAIPYATAVDPYSVFCADLDTFPGLDLAVACPASNKISILKNYGDGFFKPKVDYDVGASHPQSVFCANLDGDTDVDLAVANELSHNVSILKNYGNGNFYVDSTYPVETNPQSVFCADLDTFPGLDLAVANTSNDDNVSILKNNGDGTFQTHYNLPRVGDNPQSVFCADLDNDGDADLAVAYYSSSTVCFFNNDGNGGFDGRGCYTVGNYPQSVFCADLDGDSYLDAVTANSGTNDVSVLRNKRDWTFQAKVDYDVGGTPYSVFCADLDGNGSKDIAVANSATNNVSILLNLTISPIPSTFSLIYPKDLDSIKTPVNFIWHASTVPRPGDTIHYALYLSRSIVFNPDSTIVHDSLLDTTFTADTLDIKLWYWKVKAYDKSGAVTWSDQTWSFYVYLCGDDNGDGKITVSDVIHEINYQFKGGHAPVPLTAGDVNCDGKNSVSDVVYKINYLFKGGPNPCQGCP